MQLLSSRTIHFPVTALLGGRILEVMDFVKHDRQPVELGEGVDAVGEHRLPDDHHLHPTGVQLGLNSLIDSTITDAGVGGKQKGVQYSIVSWLASGIYHIFAEAPPLQQTGRSLAA